MRNNRKIFRLSLKNLLRYKNTVSTALLLLIFLNVYSFVSLTFVDSTQSNFETVAKIENAADYKISYLKDYKDDIENYILSNLTQIHSYTRITKASFYYKERGLDVHGGEYDDVEILGIDPNTFFETVYNIPEISFTPSSSTVQTSLLTSNLSVAVSLQFLEEEGLAINDDYSLQALASSFTHVDGDYLTPFTNITVAASFSLPYLGNLRDQRRSLIMDRSVLQSIENIQDDMDQINLEYFFLIRSDVDISESVIDYLETNYYVEVTSFQDEFNTLRNRVDWDTTEKILVINTYFSIFLSFCSLVIYGIFQVSIRLRERAVERVLGLKKSEILQMTILEKMVILASAIFIGGVLGIIYSWIGTFWFLSNIGLVQQYYIPRILFPIDKYIIYIVLLIIFMIIAVIPSIYIQQRYDIGTLLKQADLEG